MRKCIVQDCGKSQTNKENMPGVTFHRIDGVEQQIDQVGIKVNRIEKLVEENKEEIERKLEDTRRQVQKGILEKINGLEHQLHRTSIADS
ncbi:hypothetical protein NQ318_009825 [Aromia moschata]|uniref:Uncharacterized protein n=1 Tax=Aromia moschata TaxID=1265417 RepID=A0AAV8XP63_9CUCU|nr:hypothetical protein NQ318_009825 [Aromia moschata]